MGSLKGKLCPKGNVAMSQSLDMMVSASATPLQVRSCLPLRAWVGAGRALMVPYGVCEGVGQHSQTDPGSSAVFTLHRSAGGLEHNKVRDVEP